MNFSKVGENRNKPLLRRPNGFSLVELIVVLGLFATVMLMASSSFDTIVNQITQQSKSVETQIQGIVGLELLRADLEQAGFGLPWSFRSPLPDTVYKEADVTSTMPANFWPSGVSAMTFNDAATSGNGNPPRAILSNDTTFNVDSGNIGSKYIVIKSMVAATNDTAKKWALLSYDGDGNKHIRTWNSSDRDFTASEGVVVVRNSLSDIWPAVPSRQLGVNSSATPFSTTFNNATSLARPLLGGDSFVIYGVTPTTTVRMPFNRADYYVKTPTKMPSYCAPHTGVLYKANINHANGGFLEIPILDCVADIQIAYGLDTSPDGAKTGVINLHQTAALATADLQRSQLREIRVYVLAHEGKKDRSYKFPTQTIAVGESFDGGATIMGRNFDLSARIGTEWEQYRWKVYTIVVRPKNLAQ